MLEVFSSIEIEKVFRIQTFFQEYPFIISNQQKTNIKRYFIELVQTLQEYQLIENNFKIILNRKFHTTDQLTTTNISEGFIIYEKLDI
jgi:hypothetical protein